MTIAPLLTRSYPSWRRIPVWTAKRRWQTCGSAFWKTCAAQQSSARTRAKSINAVWRSTAFDRQIHRYPLLCRYHGFDLHHDLQLDRRMAVRRHDRSGRCLHFMAGCRVIRPADQPVVHSLVVDGIANGVGSVLSFLPTIVTLCSSSSRFWRTPAIWRVWPLSWIGRSASWDCPAAALCRYWSASAARFRPSWLPATVQ